MHYANFTCLNFWKFLIRRYYYYLIIGVFITLIQIFWGYYVLHVGIESKNTDSSDRTGRKPSLQHSIPLNPLLNGRRQSKRIENYAEYLVPNYSLDDDNHQDCFIKGKDALSALKRAKSVDCKMKIKALACMTERGDFFARKLISSCPSNGNSKGYRLGCYVDRTDDRILKGFKTRLLNNHPNICIDICLQRGYVYAGVEFSKECFCGSNILSSELRIPDNRCDMKCAGSTANSNCGGYLAIDIFNTGLSKIVSTTQVSITSGPPVRIAFILTVSGRSLRQIHRLIKALYSDKHFFFIHVDSRQQYLFTELLKLEKLFSNIVLSRVRYSSIWGGASLLTVLLSSMEQLINKKEWNWDFVLNLSESDYPIREMSDLTEFLTANRDRNFLKSHGQNTHSFFKKQGLDRTFLECEQHMWRIGERMLPFGIRVDGGSDWLCLERKFVEYVAFSEDKLVTELKKIFSFTLLPAESFFHTVLRNSKMCHTFTDNNLHLTNWNRKLGCRCQYKEIVDWCGCSPNDFVMSDWPKLQASGKRNLYFGRKFEPVKCLNIINKLDEHIHGKHNPGTTGLDSHWENRFHEMDHPSDRSDAALTLYHSVARLGVRSIKSCKGYLSHISEVHTLHKNDIYQGILVKYVATFDSKNITIEAFIVKDSHFRKNAEHPLATYFKDFQINSNFDLKEQMFRNFEEALGPDTKLTAVFWWHDMSSVNERSNNVFNISLILIDPLGDVAANEAISIVSDQQQVTHHLKFDKPLRPGLWSAFVISENKLLSQNVFAILRPQFHKGRQMSAIEESELDKSYESSYGVKGKDYRELIFSEDSQKEIKLFNNELTQQKSFLPVSDSIVQRMYHLKDFCIVDDKSVPSCVEKLSKCANTQWSSLSPDPKSSLM